MLARPLQLLFGWLAATLCAAALGSVVQTEINLQALATLGAEIPASVRMQTMLADLLGFAPLYAAILAAGFLPAFLVAGLILHWWPRWRPAWYALAGATAVFTALLLMRAMLGLTVIAAARSAEGMLALAAAGALGGLVFATLTARPLSPQVANTHRTLA